MRYTRKKILQMASRGPITSWGLRDPPVLLKMEREWLVERIKEISDSPRFIITEAGKLALNHEMR